MIRKAILLAFAAGVLLSAKAWYDTMRDPVLQRFVLETDQLPAGTAPFTIALIADIHMAGPDMPQSRVARIVEQVNALQPDLIAITGDLVSEKYVATRIYSPSEIIAPLADLKATHGTVLVPGTQDHWFDWPGLKSELARYPAITVLENEAVQKGPIAVGGLDDATVGYADIDATTASMLPLEGPRIMLSHNPDVFPSLPVNIDLTLAGHTHCGQIGYPKIGIWGGGAPKTMSEYGDLYSCGVARENGKTLITSAGLGTSTLPVRLFTQPEIWAIEVRGAER